MAALDEGEPIPAGLTSAATDDLTDVALAERVRQRNLATVHLGSHALMAQLRVDAVREVHRCGARGELDRVALGGHHIDLLLEQALLDPCHELGILGDVGLELDHFPQPR